MESIRYTKIVALEDMQKGIKLCRKYGILSSEYFKDWRNGIKRQNYFRLLRIL